MLFKTCADVNNH